VAAANATHLVRTALAGTGIELVASCSAEAYDARAPEAFRSAALLPGARGLVVAASAGPALWRRFRAHVDADRARWDEPHPYDAFVATELARADEALAAAGIPFRRFEAAFHAPVRVDFLAMARLVGLGSPGPFGLLIHETHGPWWALRGAWLVGAEVEPPIVHRPPCEGCSAPCVGGWEHAGGIVRASPEVRGRCVVGQGSRYDEDQIAYHYDRARTVARLRGGD
jgi:epoxyqueuosine reductase QueG